MNDLNMLIAIQAVALPFWLIHILSPYSKISLLFAKWKWGPLILSVLFLIYFIQDLSSLVDFSNSVLNTVLFKGGHLNLFAAQIMCLNLFISEVFLTKPEELRINTWLLRSILILTFFVGPLGFLVFWISTVTKLKLSKSEY